MDTAKVVISKMQGNRSFQMRQLFAERIGEPRKPSAHHSQGQVLPLDVTGAHVARVGIACDDFGYSLLKSWWGISSAPCIGRLVDLLQLREVGGIAERRSHRQTVRTPSIRGHLRMKAPRGTRVQIAHECNRVCGGALASQPRENQFCIRIHADERVLLAYFVGFFDGHSALAFLDEAMQFVNLDTSNLKVLQLVPHHLGALIGCNEKQAHDGIAVDSRKSLRGADRATLDQTLNDQSGDFRAGSHSVPRQLVVGFAECGMAGLAAPTLDTLFTEVAELLAGLVLAFYAGHGLSPLDFWRKKPLNLIEVWMRASSASELAPQPVSAGSGALSVKSYGLGWGLNRDNYGLTVSKANLNPESHADSILPESPVAAGLSHFTPNSEFILALLQKHGGMIARQMGLHHSFRLAGGEPFPSIGPSIRPRYFFDLILPMQPFNRVVYVDQKYSLVGLRIEFSKNVPNLYRRERPCGIDLQQAANSISKSFFICERRRRNYGLNYLFLSGHFRGFHCCNQSFNSLGDLIAQRYQSVYFSGEFSNYGVVVGHDSGG